MRDKILQGYFIFLLEGGGKKAVKTLSGEF
jgi:hypothetical protein